MAIGMARGIERARREIVGEPEGLVVALTLLVLDDAALVIELLLADRAQEIAHAIALEPQRLFERARRHRLIIVGAVKPGRAIVARRAHRLQRHEIIIVAILRAVEHQMLEEMREARLARWLVLRADIVPDRERDHRRLAVGVDDDPEAIVERETVVRNVNLARELSQRAVGLGGMAWLTALRGQVGSGLLRTAANRGGCRGAGLGVGGERQHRPACDRAVDRAGERSALGAIGISVAGDAGAAALLILLAFVAARRIGCRLGPGRRCEQGDRRGRGEQFGFHLILPRRARRVRGHREGRARRALPEGGWTNGQEVSTNDRRAIGSGIARAMRLTRERRAIERRAPQGRIARVPAVARPSCQAGSGAAGSGGSRQVMPARAERQGEMR